MCSHLPLALLLSCLLLASGILTPVGPLSAVVHRASSFFCLVLHHHWRCWLWLSGPSLFFGVASSSATWWLFTALKFASDTSNATTRCAPLRDRWFAAGTRAPRRRSLPQCGPLFVRSGFSLSGLGIRPRCDQLMPPTPQCGS